MASSSETRRGERRNRKLIDQWIDKNPEREQILREAIRVFIEERWHYNYGWPSFYRDVKAEWPDFPGRDRQLLVKWAEENMPELFAGDGSPDRGRK